jgi:hypothetical protein
MDRSIRRIGQPIQIDPGDAILQQLYTAQGNWSVLQEMVRKLFVPDSVDPSKTETALFDPQMSSYPVLNKMPEISDFDFEVIRKQDGFEIVDPLSMDPESNDQDNLDPVEQQSIEAVVQIEDDPEVLYGPDHLGDLESHVLWKMYVEASDRVVRYAKVAIETGVQERRLAMDEAMAQFMIRSYIRAIDDPRANLSIEQRNMLRSLIAQRMKEVVSSPPILESEYNE